VPRRSLDISKRTRAEAERSFLASIVESSEDAIFVRTLEGVILTWNPGAQRMFGYSAAEAVGRSVWVLIPADLAEEVSQINAKIKRGKRMEQYETVRLRKDGSSLYVSLTNSPMRDTKGTVTGVSTIARDITKRKLLELQILEINEILQRRVGQDLHDGLSQELRGIAYLSHVLRQTLLEKGLPEAQTATRITDLLQRAISQVRDLARGLTPLRLEANGLMAALNELAAGTQSIYGIQCSFTCPKPVLVSNRSTAIHLYRIAQEAVHNAVKHGAPKRVVIELARARTSLKLTVTDNGKGLPANSRKGKGMGLKIMDYRAGTIGGVLKVERATERGTRVSCMLPMAAPNAFRSRL
jgi:PAS domain S-box-containing protein